MNGWDINQTGKSVVASAKDAGKVTMDAVIQAQKGATVIAACKNAVTMTPGIPENVKALINTEGYGDVVIGILAQTLVNSFSSNPKAQELARIANVFGSTIASSKVTMIQDLLANTILGIAEKGKGIAEMVENVK